MGLITAADLIARPGFENLDSVQAQTLIDDASALVRLEAGTALDSVVAPNAPGAVVAVLVAMIRRGWRNPMGNASESLGDYAFTAGTSGGVATMYLTNRERRIVRRAVGGSGVSSLNMTGDLPASPLDDYYLGLGEETAE